MKNANDFYGSHNGTEHYYRDELGNVHYTDGVKDLMDGCQSWWLMDLILSHQANPKVKRERFQVWELKKVNGFCFKVRCTDGNDHKVTGQEIPFGDFPYDTATIWLVDGIMLLPSEY